MALSDITPQRRAQRTRFGTWSILLGLLILFGVAGVPPQGGGTESLLRAATSTRSSEPEELTAGDVTLRQVASFRLDHPALGLTFRGPRDGYIALGSGEIAYFRISGKDLVTRIVATGLSQARGIAYLNGRVYVTDITVPCKVIPRFGMVRCRASDFPPGEWPGAAQVKILLEGNGRVLAYDANPDGSLGDQKVILDRLPVSTSDHAVNQIVAGRDGWLYVSIGNIDTLYSLLEKVRALDRPNLNLLGTIVRVRPDGKDRTIFVRGLRNVYDVTFDGEGRLYGIDNDGPTQNGYRAEEVLRFRPGADYGYPVDGTFGPFHQRTSGPVWTMITVRGGGSAGLAWGPDVGLPEGLVSGACGQLTYLRLRPGTGRPFSSADELPLTTLRGCAPIVRASPERLLVVGTVGPNRLTLFQVTRTPS